MALGTAQFLMVLDTSVMNVSISQLVEDFDTTVTAIQAVITIYTLVMAAFMLLGGKVADLIGRRRAFAVGLVIYGVGSLLTSLAPTLGVLVLGWSIIEGLGAALVLPALAALVGGNYAGRDRAMAYGVIGGLAGAGIAVGPLLGGWVTTNLTWRLVFAGEVVVVLCILAVLRWVDDAPVTGPRVRLDVVGGVLSVVGLTLVVLGVLQSTEWGWLRPREAPFTVLGFSPTPFVIAAGLATLGLLRGWLRRREERGQDPLLHWSLFDIPPLRAAVTTLLAQNLILLGVFFTVPLYLQVVQGLNAFETGLRLLPVSVLMLVTAMSAPLLNRVAAPRSVVRAGFALLVLATVWLVSAIDPELDDASFAAAMALLGIGMGLLAAQLGNVAQSSVGEAERSEVGGLQYTAQNLGSSLGTAFIGSVLIGALTVSAERGITDNPAISDAVQQEVGVAISGGVGFVPVDQARAALERAGISPSEVGALLDTYAQAQLEGLKVALLAAAAIALLSLFLTRQLPTTRLADTGPAGAPRVESARSA
ncbi:drug resistance transporter, EmrB/QacA subfamily [Geodermatophilus ruber]|uniref:Drug resistance transporter, EmrB/QacA subfamily n=1 Tax=Geodermatophilus ruber TaxID=504800 RepID=A0A1I4KKL0_9ACTN|nr:drug resistance transporter, EmrB/QacA subfamily [Geodermatophilus ruber]